VDRFEFFARLPRNEPGGVAFTNAYLTAVPGDYGGVLWSLVNRSEFHLIR
jgi:hypothetical protein